ncbi:hypothetical protein MJO28_009064 [Puccinia striiformis f. sp. tritici]|uniref:Auxin efflux carrier n=2 Tax=Puccinia striiformis f. sp. tritici TaxID=168172 RepID=A0A0L0W5D6_9BASI|nr:hypothetical protein Pst134EA_017992 [Puccinia striiformis f. sp. tritici]KAH9451427.1 hypothetical protein Pst134EB_018896 [Puccinia striiformis f. sp. tritici]KAH9461706.1 hypothetical protein Pst134EA_017992 [Puccinia striiformis f. sp. tritici]KAI7947156.1 hypothetical protein MJO28_009064 [Puccinia striiformis f. sp. tritici]KNF06736.1 hypothetical protein PSTG_00052 [Puccinia striiformis f. sp. tritici PST-78]
MEVNIKDIIRTVAESILQIAAFCLIGYIAALRGIIDVKVRRQMTRVNVAVFTPALMFSKVAFSLTPDLLIQLWVIPVGYLVLSFVSAAVAWGLGMCFGLSMIRRNVSIAGATFMNSNTLPIALMQTMSATLTLKWKEDDTAEKALDRSFQYLVLCTVLGSVLRWSVGVALLNATEKPVKPKGVNTKILTDPPTREADADSDPSSSGPITPHSAVFNGDLEASTLPPSGRHTEVQKGCLIEVKTGAQCPKSSKANFFQKNWPNLCRRINKLDPRPFIPKGIRKAADELLNPPLIAAFAAIFVACIKPLQDGLGSIQPLREFISTAADAAIPLTLVLLGAFFHRPPKDKKPQTYDAPQKDDGTQTDDATETDDSKSQLTKEKRVHSWTSLLDITLTLLARHIITPLMLLPVLAYICWKSDQSDVVRDPVFILSATLIVGAPPAITLAQMAAKADLDIFDETISKLLLWSYALATPITTIILVVGAMLIYKSTL